MPSTRHCAALLIACCLASGWLAPVVARAAPPPPADAASRPSVTADAAVLIDARTGRVLYAKSADTPRAPASTTKMMTALIALEQGNLAASVTVGPRAAATPGSSAGLRAGERYTLGALLRGLLLRSGNDAAVAIADHIAGSVQAFAALMNARAQALGLQNTHFVNPHGLTEPFHYSSAYDLARIARAGLSLPTFAAIVDSATARISGYDRLQRAFHRELRNTNRLLLAYDWIDGVKTGTTRAAGNCLVASGSRGGLRLIAVVLHSDHRWGDALRLLQWGFIHFSDRTLAAGDVVGRIPVRDTLQPGEQIDAVSAQTLAMPVALSELPRTHLRLQLPTTLRAPVRAGQVLGTAELERAGEVLGRVPLVARTSMPRAPWYLRWWRKAWPWSARTQSTVRSAPPSQ